MAENTARPITTNQSGPHDKVAELARRYLHSSSQRPVSEHTKQAFDQACEWLNGWHGEIILDSCCGVGESTAHLAARYPDARVLGLDKSAHRLAKHSHYAASTSNYRVIRADVNDFWRLAADHQWQPVKHFILYPNPYPKSSQVQKRWHCSPALADILRLGGELVVRSNWHIYVEEFALALAEAGIDGRVEQYQAEQPMTPFERKYWDSGQSSWQMTAKLR